MSTKGSWMGEDYSWHSNYECTTQGWVLLKGWWLIISIILLRKVTVFLALIIFYLRFLLKWIWQKFTLLPTYVRTSKLWLRQNNLKRTCTCSWGFHVGLTLEDVSVFNHHFLLRWDAYQLAVWGERLRLPPRIPAHPGLLQVSAWLLMMMQDYWVHILGY